MARSARTFQMCCQANDALYCCSGVSGANTLARLDGTVRYKVVIINGNRTIPANSQLDVTTTGGYSVTGPCKHGVSPTETAVPLRANLASIPPREAITCEFDVTVTGTDKDNGEIAPFQITAQFTGTGVDRAHYIKPVNSDSVPVHTGGQLSNIDSQVMLGDSTKYHTGRVMKLILNCNSSALMACVIIQQVFDKLVVALIAAQTMHVISSSNMIGYTGHMCTMTPAVSGRKRQ